MAMKAKRSTQSLRIEHNKHTTKHTNSDFPVAIIVEDTIQQSSFTTSEEAC